MELSVVKTILESLSQIISLFPAPNYKKQYEEIIMPVYKSVGIVHSDYLGIFDNALAILGSGGSPSDASKYILSARLKYDQFRGQFRVNLYSFISKYDLGTPEQIFILLVCDYFAQNPESNRLRDNKYPFFSTYELEQLLKKMEGAGNLRYSTISSWFAEEIERLTTTESISRIRKMKELLNDRMVCINIAFDKYVDAYGLPRPP